VQLHAGTYRLTVAGRSLSADSGAVEGRIALEIVHGGIFIARREFAEPFAEQGVCTIDFELSHATAAVLHEGRFEFRLWTDGVHDVQIDHVLLRHLDSDAILEQPSVEWLSLLSVGGSGARSANGRISTISGVSGNVFYGPYTILAPGHYQLSVECDVSVDAQLSGEVLIEAISALTLTIASAKFPLADAGVKRFLLPFSIPDPGPGGCFPDRVEFHLETNALANLSVKSVVCRRWEGPKLNSNPILRPVGRLLVGRSVDHDQLRIRIQLESARLDRLAACHEKEQDTHARPEESDLASASENEQDRQVRGLEQSDPAPPRDGEQDAHVQPEESDLLSASENEQDRQVRGLEQSDAASLTERRPNMNFRATIRNALRRIRFGQRVRRWPWGIPHIRLNREIASKAASTATAAGASSATASDVAASATADRRLDALYVALEDALRGSREDIKARLAPYIDRVSLAGVGRSNAPILDVGCGRGEWLELLKENHLAAYGIDSNTVMIDRAKSLGLDARRADLQQHLVGLPDDALSGLTAFHVIEHLPFETLVEFFHQTFRVLQPGGILILETPNPETMRVGATTFYNDPTHRNPITPVLLHFLVEHHGFKELEILRLHPFPHSNRLHDTGRDTAHLNIVIFGHQDYAIIARRYQT